MSIFLYFSLILPVSSGRPEQAEIFLAHLAMARASIEIKRAEKLK